MLAGMLHLPGGPAININLSGEGPLSNWAGKLQAALDGQPTGVDRWPSRHFRRRAAPYRREGRRRRPIHCCRRPFRPLFAGQTTIDLSATFDGEGKIDIRTRQSRNRQRCHRRLWHALDPSGNNSLNANLLGTSGPVDFRWPMEDGEVRAMISRVDVALTGAARSVKIDAKASLESASTPQGQIGGQVNLSAKSDAFNLTNEVRPPAASPRYRPDRFHQPRSQPPDPCADRA